MSVCSPVLSLSRPQALKAGACDGNKAIVCMHMFDSYLCSVVLVKVYAFSLIVIVSLAILKGN